MASRYLMQIVDAITGEVIQFAPGHAIERDFVASCVDHVLKAVDFKISASSDEFVESCVHAITDRGVGVLKTTNHVADDIRDGVREVLFKNGFDVEVQAANETLAIRTQHGIESAILQLKKLVKP